LIVEGTLLVKVPMQRYVTLTLPKSLGLKPFLTTFVRQILYQCWPDLLCCGSWLA